VIVALCGAFDEDEESTPRDRQQQKLAQSLRDKSEQRRARDKLYRKKRRGSSATGLIKNPKL
jgi:hypothetical protein